ncbi:hypothetical protein MHH70_14550 [Metasolibacillus sp. FSL H7-0170]|uniref:hypothetical protein n=1 Tax=Metasolibacillus sp. FSL H7-0170 TaxID=2921431 RepID=UPI00315906CE
MKRKIVASCILLICVVTVMMGVSYIPQKLLKVEEKEVLKIEITNGFTGEKTEVMNAAQISQILLNLTDITIQKEQSAKDLKGYHYSITIYTDKGLAQQLAIHDEETVIYKDALYKTKGKSIDKAYIEHLLKEVTNI